MTTGQYRTVRTPLPESPYEKPTKEVYQSAVRTVRSVRPNVGTPAYRIILDLGEPAYGDRIQVVKSVLKWLWRKHGARCRRVHMEALRP